MPEQTMALSDNTAKSAKSCFTYCLRLMNYFVPKISGCYSYLSADFMIYFFIEEMIVKKRSSESGAFMFYHTAAGGHLFMNVCVCVCVSFYQC